MAPDASTHSSPQMNPRFISVQKRGGLVLPPDVRKLLHLDRAGAQVEVSVRADGVLELRPYVAVPADQAWFWTDEWQAGERQVDEEIAAGSEVIYDSAEDFAAYLDEVVAEPTTQV